MDYSLNQAFGKGHKLVQVSKILRNYNTPREDLQPVDELEERSDSKKSNAGSQRGENSLDNLQMPDNPNVEGQIELQLADISRSNSVDEWSNVKCEPSVKGKIVVAEDQHVNMQVLQK